MREGEIWPVMEQMAQIPSVEQILCIETINQRSTQE